MRHPFPRQRSILIQVVHCHPPTDRFDHAVDGVIVGTLRADILAGGPGRNALMRGVKPMCARGVRSFWLAQYDMDHADGIERWGFLDKVRRRLGSL